MHRCAASWSCWSLCLPWRCCHEPANHHLKRCDPDGLWACDRGRLAGERTALMASVSISAIPGAAWECLPTASACSNDHQQGGRSTGPLPRERRVHPTQNRSLVPSQAAHRNIQASRGVFRHSLAVAFRADASALYSRRLAVCRPLRAFPLRACRPSCGYPLSHQQVVQAVVDGSHRHPNSLSKSSSSAGFKTSQKVLQGHGNRTQERGFITQGSATND